MSAGRWTMAMASERCLAATADFAAQIAERLEAANRGTMARRLSMSERSLRRLMAPLRSGEALTLDAMLRIAGSLRYRLAVVAYPEDGTQPATVTEMQATQADVEDARELLSGYRPDLAAGSMCDAIRSLITRANRDRCWEVAGGGQGAGPIPINEHGRGGGFRSSGRG